MRPLACAAALAAPKPKAFSATAEAKGESAALELAKEVAPCFKDLIASSMTLLAALRSKLLPLTSSTKVSRFGLTSVAPAERWASAKLSSAA